VVYHFKEKSKVVRREKKYQAKGERGVFHFLKKKGGGSGLEGVNPRVKGLLILCLRPMRGEYISFLEE